MCAKNKINKLIEKKKKKNPTTSNTLWSFPF